MMSTSGAAVPVSKSELHGYVLELSNAMTVSYQGVEVADRGKLGLVQNACMDIPVSDAKGLLTDLVKRAEHGEKIVLTRHGRPVARLAAGVSLPFRRFDKIQTVEPGEIVENKRLGAALAMVRQRQDTYEPHRRRDHPARQRPPNNLKAPGQGDGKAGASTETGKLPRPGGQGVISTFRAATLLTGRKCLFKRGRTP
jgi:antitoxin (DNA-binding transcriptional repressor) of toxin-antitoxin stability system